MEVILLYIGILCGCAAGAIFFYEYVYKIGKDHKKS